MDTRPTRGPLASAYIGIGSNLNDPKRQVQQAVASLERDTGIQRVQISPWYRSRAVGPGNQPDYVNGAAKVETRLSPQRLLERLQAIENAQGRIRTERWGARTLDLDLLLYDDRIIETETLVLPHPRLCERNFVVRPLLDLDPTLYLPDGRALANILPIIGTADLEPLA